MNRARIAGATAGVVSIVLVCLSVYIVQRPSTPSTAVRKQPVINTALSVTHHPVEQTFSPDDTVIMEVIIARKGNQRIDNLVLEEALPRGWAFMACIDGDMPEALPAYGAAGKLSFTWTNRNRFPIRFRYELNVSNGSTAPVHLSGQVKYWINGKLRSSARHPVVLVPESRKALLQR